MSKIELADYLRSDCELLKPASPMLIDIYNMTNGMPCNGCGYKENCKTRHTFELVANQKSHGQKRNIVGETNQQIAERLCISKRQVSKMRKKGEL